MEDGFILWYTCDMAPPEIKNDSKKTVIKTIKLFVFTVIVGFVVGTGLIPFLVPRSGMGGYLELIPIFFSVQWFWAAISTFIYKTIVLTLPFFIVGWRSKTWWIILVPITAYEMTEGLLTRLIPLNSDFFRYIIMHFFPQVNSSDPFSYTTLYKTVIYALAFALIAGCFYLITLRKDNWQLNLAMAIVLLGIIPAGIATSINSTGTPLYRAEQRAQDVIYIPTTDTIFGDGQQIIYAPMQHLAGVYQNSDDISYKRISSNDEWSTKKSCGADVKKTAAGHEYITFSKSGEKADYICFVIGSYKYTVSRDYAFDGVDYLQTYPAESVVDAIYSGSPIVYSCSTLNRYSAVASYCDDKDTKQASDVLTAGSNRFTIICKDSNYDDQHQPICKQIINRN